MNILVIYEIIMYGTHYYNIPIEALNNEYDALLKAANGAVVNVDENAGAAVALIELLDGDWAKFKIDLPLGKGPFQEVYVVGVYP